MTLGCSCLLQHHAREHQQLIFLLFCCREWTFHIQAGAGIVADSKPEAEYEETVAKAAAMGRAIDVAESAFGVPPSSS